ncbi:DUF4226 domain-containing protein [Mycobacterium timonense]|uniref:Biofilm regulator BssS n=1 Tax=Mycobacterium timonense TaxID=701043 RepID=A0ABX3THT5_9MYCO|nr:DUF4226 domain-containing protein [Mycobacterium timonense]ORB78328.1 hypothetical protein BST46_19845 [Mycobacterium timonense]
MSAYDDLLAAVNDVRDRTGDPNAWQTGLAPAEVSAVITPRTRPEQLQAILAKIRRQHAEVFGAAPTGVARPPADAGPAPDRESGAAADAIASAEAALAQQNSVSSQLDMQVVTAILNAHLKAVDGREALTKLQQETEAAVRTRSDLDTPAGARDFQRFLIGKLRDIRAVVLNASLDDTSKSALMAAWTSLYDAAKNDRPGDHVSSAGAAADAAAAGTSDQPDEDLDDEWEPLLDSLLADDDGSPIDPAAALDPLGGNTIPPAPPPAMAPALPSFGGGSLPGLGATPASMSGWETPGGLPLSGLQAGDARDPALQDLADEDLPEDQGQQHDSPADGSAEQADDENASADEPPAGPTSVTLPDGETVTAASPQLAAAIKAAVAGTPIAEAFQQQGMTLPAPGTAVANPVDVVRVSPGDIGMFTDRHALALGPGKALLDGQIQHSATVSGPSFLGWEHPPAAAASVTAPAKPDPPTPTRPASSSTT